MSICHNLILSDPVFTDVACTSLLYVDERLNYEQAKRKCEEYDSTLLEIWNEYEYNQVRYPYQSLLK